MGAGRANTYLPLVPCLSFAYAAYLGYFEGDVSVVYSIVGRSER